MYCSLLDLSMCCQVDVQENPYALFNENTKQYLNPAIRQRELYKARFQENFLSLIT